MVIVVCLFNWYFCSLGPHLEKPIKMFTYDDQTSHGVSTIPVLRVYTCHVIKILLLMPEIDQNVYVNNALSSAPPDGVHCGSSDSARKARYLLTHIDRFQALIIICG